MSSHPLSPSSERPARGSFVASFYASSFAAVLAVDAFIGYVFWMAVSKLV
jgi:hypothetical protein